MLVCWLLGRLAPYIPDYLMTNKIVRSDLTEVYPTYIQKRITHLLVAVGVEFNILLIPR